MLDIGKGIIHGPYSKGAYNDCSQRTEGDREFQEVKFGWALAEQKEKGRPRNSRRGKDLNKEEDSCEQLGSTEYIWRWLVRLEREDQKRYMSDQGRVQARLHKSCS